MLGLHQSALAQACNVARELSLVEVSQFVYLLHIGIDAFRSLLFDDRVYSTALAHALASLLKFALTTLECANGDVEPCDVI